MKAGFCLQGRWREGTCAELPHWLGHTMATRVVQGCVLYFTVIHVFFVDAVILGHIV